MLRFHDDRTGTAQIQGIPVSGNIDDVHSAAKSFVRTLQQGFFIMRLLAALGAYVKIPKCVFTPCQELTCLEFLLNTLLQTFKVAPAIETWEDQNGFTGCNHVIPSMSARSLTALVGKLVAVNPAVFPALLFSRTIFQAMAGKKDWDVVLLPSQAVKQEAQSWLDNIDAWNKRFWWPTLSIIILDIDASAIEYGSGLICAEGQRRLPMAGTFSFERGRRIIKRSLRDNRKHAGTGGTGSNRPQDLNQSSVFLQGNSQAALSALRKFASSNTIIHEHLKRLFSLCATHIDIIPRWIPKEKLAEADELSRRPDALD